MSALEKISHGMMVFDASGEELGTVAQVKPANERAADLEELVAESRQSIINTVLSSMIGAEPRAPAAMTVRLLRGGYIKIHGEGLWGQSRYAAADAIGDIADGRVTLTLTREELSAQE